MNDKATSQDFFETKYQQNPDPWNFAGSSYEQSRYAAILGALPERQYQRGFEPGCSIGVLTASLALRCKALEAVDISPSAVLRAQERCKRLNNVTIRCGALPEAIPSGTFDVIILSEIGYYFKIPSLQDLIQSLATALDRGGVLVAAHWLGQSEDHLLSGDEVHEAIRRCPQLTLVQEQRYPLFRLDRMVRQ